jgi:hypothetical protein
LLQDLIPSSSDHAIKQGNKLKIEAENILTLEKISALLISTYSPKDKQMVFVLLPFDNQISWIYNDVIKPTVEEKSSM